MATLPPPKGSLPVLQYCTPAQLDVDRTYQRELDQRSLRLVAEIARDWDWGLCQPLVVARRRDGRMFVVDGQHRLEAARRRGDIQQLPCVIIMPDSDGDEASAFVKLNQQRRPLTPFALYRGAVAAGDPSACALASVLREVGFALSGTADWTHMKPGQLNNVGKVRAFHAKHGDRATRVVLECLAAAFPAQVLQMCGTIWAGVAAVVATHGPALDVDLFTELLGAASQDEWLGEFRAHAAANSCLVAHAAAPVLLAAYAESLAE